MNIAGGIRMININKKIVASLLMGFAVVNFSISTVAFAADSQNINDINELIKQQEAILTKLNDEKNKQREDEVQANIAKLREQVDRLIKNQNTYDAENAINSLVMQIKSIENELSQQRKAQDEFIKKIEQLQKTQVSSNTISVSNETAFYGTAATKKFLVNPGPSTAVGYTQDAINAQGDSTMVFSYAPNQLYKIYCKVGYLTDLAFKKGEKITYVGGGDTAKWMIDTAEADGTPHMYIKPINPNATTNLIVNTTKHSYQIICNAGDWYNPMVSWSYSAEERFANNMQAKKDEQIYTSQLNISHPEQLNFGYQIDGKSKWKPDMVFDDGEKTYIQFNSMSKNKMPILFIKEPNKKDISLVNYRIKDNYYIVDKLFIEAELRVSDKEKIKITKK